jgi:hypothetical protein
MDQGTPERWEPVPEFPRHYEASNWGRIRSLPRKSGNNRWYGGKVLAPQAVNKWGHLKVTLTVNGVYHQRLVHRLVMEAFVGPCPEGQEVRHLDGHPANNRLENLAYGTRQDNMLDVLRYGVHHNTAKTHCKYGHKYTPDNTYIGSHGDRNCRTCITDRHKK